ncbi:TlpA family protein disulfide reductase [Chitinophaga eiseniae]|uniref:Redoxin domain-containing protein n=1 Tax=Chitinophaga eiseniae TaxID=634771 RepID=A0A847SSC0_9BACT|nr:TlpA disulfide reductase family protein [Chitinophaga eiseniae]NLR79092.1 redoxin domain-containing protein [Chitinophaga eiseniae]
MRILSIMLCAALFTGVVRAQTFSDLYNAVKSEPDPVKMGGIVKIMEKRVREGKGEEHQVQYCRQLVAVAFANEENFEKARQWANQIGDTSIKLTALYNVIDRMIAVGRFEDAEKLLKPTWEQVKKNGSRLQGAGGPFEDRGPGAAEFGALYGKILYEKGTYRESLEYLAPAFAGSSRRAGRELYAMALAKAGETDKALEQMNQLMLSQESRSEEFNAVTRKIFIEKYGDDKRYLWLKDSITADHKKKLEEKISKMKVNIPAPDFTLTDLTGKTVSLQSLRGKTVILDFWATWCQPCVGSFPGMQKAVDYYRNDTSVVFMFIHTFERSDHATDDAKRLLAYRKYRFDVYMDLKDTTTGKNEVVNKYGVKAIPTKFIIDRNGIIRYRNTGYISVDEAIPEISMMIQSIN